MNLLPDLLALTGLICFSAGLLVFARSRLTPDEEQIVEEVNSLLPQTQCAQCGYPGCRPYAEAVVEGEAINLCPPGGETTARQLADLLGRAGELTAVENSEPVVAKIIEDECIGCTLCIVACPVDAIIGAQQQMHTVITDHCTGCELCIEPCPVDCIELEPLPTADVVEFPIEETACINCGFCEVVCPRELKPQLLYQSRDDATALPALKLDDCIECMKCDQVCPSQLQLTTTFQVAKYRQRQNEKERAGISLNEQRYLARQARLDNKQAEVISKPTGADRKALLDSIRSNR